MIHCVMNQSAVKDNDANNESIRVTRRGINEKSVSESFRIKLITLKNNLIIIFLNEW